MQPRIDDRDWCAARLAAGDTVAAIGAAAGVSRQTASSWLKRHGLQAANQPHPRPTPEQMTADYARVGSIRRLADEYDISPAVMRTWLFEAGVELPKPGRPRKLTIDTAAVAERRRRGDTWVAIAADLGVSVDTVRRRLPDAD